MTSLCTKEYTITKDRFFNKLHANYNVTVILNAY